MDFCRCIPFFVSFLIGVFLHFIWPFFSDAVFCSSTGVSSFAFLETHHVCCIFSSFIEISNALGCLLGYGSYPSFFACGSYSFFSAWISGILAIPPPSNFVSPLFHLGCPKMLVHFEKSKKQLFKFPKLTFINV